MPHHRACGGGGRGKHDKNMYFSHRSYKFKIDMKVSLNFMYYMYYVLISRVFLSMFVKNHCLQSLQCTLIQEARRDR